MGTSVEAKPAAPIAANGDSKDPTYATTPVWLPKPVAENAAAEAKAEGEMKPYTETVPDTDAKFDMVPIKGGKFMMGSSDEDFRRHNPKDESDKDAKEKPTTKARSTKSKSSRSGWASAKSPGKSTNCGA